MTTKQKRRQEKRRRHARIVPTYAPVPVENGHTQRPFGRFRRFLGR
jgi:hypothetical protein